MTFFENLSKKVGEAAQTAAKKSGDLMEVTKINMSINNEEDKIKKKYLEIGKKVFEMCSQDSEDVLAFKEDCDAIKRHQEQIKDLKAKIIVVKGLKKCTGCGSELEMNLLFCPKCGSKQEPVQETPPQPQGISCSSCGSIVNEGSAFCQSCGIKV